MIYFFCIGVADGVGGWRAYGIDPGEFSSYLMRTCERLVRMGHFKLSEPGDLLAKSYYELLEHKKPILGKIMESFYYMYRPIQCFYYTRSLCKTLYEKCNLNLSYF